MKRTHTLSLLVTCLALLGAPARAQDETHDLRPIWRTGQKSTYEGKSNRLVKRRLILPGIETQEIETSFVFTSKFEWEVTEANPDGGGTARMTVVGLEMVLTDAKGEDHKITKSSAEEGYEPLQDLVGAMIDKPLTVEIDATGRVTSIKGYKAVINQAGEAGESLTERDFIEMAYDLAVLVGGAGGVSVGDSWNDKPEWDHEFGSLKYDTDFTLNGVETIAGIPVALVGADTEIKFKFDKSKLTEGNDGPDIGVKMKDAAQAGQYLFDVSRREIAGAFVERTLAFEMTISAQGRVIKQQIENQYTSELIRASEQ